MSSWYVNLEDNLVQQLKDVKPRDLRFFRVEEFLRNASRADQFAGSCRECQSFRHEIDKQKDSVARAINIPGSERRNFDRLQSGLSKHMRKKHGFYPPFYHSYLYSTSLAGILVIIALLLSRLFPDTEIFVFLAPAFALGIVVGQVVGGRKDKQVRDNNKLL